jgi:hypothetical protein
MPAQRTFTMSDQHWFAALSGDRNPMHLDPVAARRTTAGVPVVHGVHLLLWSLDWISASLGQMPPTASLRVNFDTFVGVDEAVDLSLLRQDSVGLRAELRVAGALAMVVAAGFGDATTNCGRAVPATLRAGEAFAGNEPLDLTLDAMTGRAGLVGPATAVAEMAAAFPHAARMLGASRTAGLGALTRLVGMACPGLHSIFNSLSLKACDCPACDTDQIAYRVDRLDPRFRRLVEDVSGCGWSGSVTSSARHPPTPQPMMHTLKGLIAADAFQGSTSLVVGGSRGLGELTAKLIASGGGRVIVTYAAGKSDAEILVNAIEAAGGAASSIHYDVLADPKTQIQAIEDAPTHLYYFATPAIMDRRGGGFSDRRFANYVGFYISGFSRLIDALLARSPQGLRCLYPSTIAIDDRPRGMTEYTMAKAAGEVLCAHLEAAHQNLRILRPRLPRLPTDQTASLQAVEAGDPVAVLLPLIRALHEN